MVLVVEECSRILNCPIKALCYRLNHPSDRKLVLNTLIGRKVQTTYKDRNGIQKTFFIGGITTKGADCLLAYGRLRRPFNVNIAAYFYTRHRIKLHHPFHHCIIERSSKGGKDRYYPMELLQSVEDRLKSNGKRRPFTAHPEGKCTHKLFKDITKIKEDEEEEEESEKEEEEDDSVTYGKWRPFCSLW